MSIENLNLTEEQKAKLKPIMDSEVYITCPICNVTFLKTTAWKFALKFQLNKPSKEYLASAKHWIETKHPIVARLHGTFQVLSSFWENQLQGQNVTEEQFKQSLEEMSK
jgi:hypothetical protein